MTHGSPVLNFTFCFPYKLHATDFCFNSRLSDQTWDGYIGNLNHFLSHNTSFDQGFLNAKNDMWINGKFLCMSFCMHGLYSLVHHLTFSDF